MKIVKIISKIIGVILIIILVKIAFGILLSTSEKVQKSFQDRVNKQVDTTQNKHLLLLRPHYYLRQDS